MTGETVELCGMKMEVYSLNTVIVGTGAAGFNTADSLYDFGQKDIAIITEGINMGTSRNTGSDKQTYYKLTLAGGEQDSVLDMARTLFNGECMHGDIALVEAALSAKCFYKLANIGVPFPHNRYGEYIGYKTDHDPRQRATSAGPLTSKFMTERLEALVRQKNIRIFNGFQVIGILTGETDTGDEARVVGLIALNLKELKSPNMGLTLFNCTNVVYATGGPSGIYKASVYPESQTGASGIAFEAGAKGINLTESQYGIASIKFRWNLSGTYQQVLPRYVSTDMDGGDEKEFLEEYFEEPGKMLDAVFLKGYQWPFDPRKISNYGSSLIDILVYNETQIKGRRVFLDFTKNPGSGSRSGEIDFSILGSEAYNYLKNSGALFGTPIQRLERMNRPAIDLYRSKGIDLTNEYLEIAVCAQHNNGGLLGNIWWESNLRHFFPVGEVNGTFGVYRPGGSALNSTQVGSLRAAQYISANYDEEPPAAEAFMETVKQEVERVIITAREFTEGMDGKGSNVLQIRQKIQARMTKYGAHIRSIEGTEAGVEQCISELGQLTGETRLSGIHELPFAFMNRDILITQLIYLNAIKEYIKKGGRSRGSYLIHDNYGAQPVSGLSEEFRYSIEPGYLSDAVCEMTYRDGQCHAEWKTVRPIPVEDNWFENIWKDYRDGNIVKC